MNTLASNGGFSFIDGVLSVFFGNRITRVKRIHKILSERSDEDAIRADFEKVGEDLHSAMDSEFGKIYEKNKASLTQTSDMHCESY
jgi:hypothetical protein